MKHLLLIGLLLLAVGVSACSPASGDPVPPPAERPDAPQTPDESDPTMHITLTIGGRSFAATLDDNAAAAAFRKLLPLTIRMSELNGNEKYHYLSASLPTASVPYATIHAGDLLLYGNNCVVLFYKTFSSGYSYTPLGRLTDPARLAEAVGSGDATVTFAADENN